MFARSTTITGDPAQVDVGVGFVRDEAMPTLMEIDGCTGLSCLVDRDAGRLIATSSWTTEEAMRASESQAAGLRDRVREIMQGSLTVEEWEVAVMHRAHDSMSGACCRVTWMRTGHADIDRSVDVYRTMVLPAAERLAGFCSASLLLDRAGGRACSTTTWDTRDAMDASRDQAWAIRDASVREAGVDVDDVAEFDLALAHLRIPELV
jgi:heme-degrading monooxygenase HmoA